MDEKSGQQAYMIPSQAPRRPRAVTVLALIVFVALYTLWLWQPLAVSFLGLDHPAAQPSLDDVAINGLVPLEAHIISKCADTQVCSHWSIFYPLPLSVLLTRSRMLSKT